MKKNNSKINEFNILFVAIQFILTIAVIVFLILSLFVSGDFYKYLEVIMGFDLLMIGYNNHRIYQRKNITILYVGIGIFLIIAGVLGFIGVV